MPAIAFVFRLPGGRQSLAASSPPAPTKRRPPSFNRRMTISWRAAVSCRLFSSGADKAAPSIVQPAHDHLLEGGSLLPPLGQAPVDAVD